MRYEDMIDLPHHVSPTRPPMSMHDRAAQFMPFRALTGYEDAVRETARLTEEEPELTEEEKALLDLRLQMLAEKIDSHPSVTLTYFQPDKKKSGGRYITAAGQLKKIDEYAGELVLLGGKHIPIKHILELL